MNKPIKRFVAGAVCPRCAAMDKLRVYRDDTHEHRECVACDYSDAMRLDGAPAPEEMTTRVNAPRQTVSDQEQVIQFVPNPALKKGTDRE